MSHAALVIPTIDRLGGAEQQLLLLAGGLTRRGWRVTVIALASQGGHAAETLHSAGIAFLSLHMRKGLLDPRGWWRLQKWLHQHKPDIVHAHLPHAAFMARWSRLLAPGPVFLDTLHSTATGPLGRRLGYRLSARLPHSVTAVSSAVAQSHLAARTVRPDRLHVLPNGIDTQHWRPDPQVRREVRAELGLADEFLWLAAGRLEPVKDYPTLLRAFAGLPAATHLVIAGAGPQLAELRQLAGQLQLHRQLRFLGFCGDVRRWMQAADGFVLPSLWEGLPMALLEAASCALPIVASDLPAIREILTPNQSALLTPPGDVPALQSAMTALMETPPGLRHAMGQSARQSAREKFDLSSILDRWEILYKLGRCP